MKTAVSIGKCVILARGIGTRMRREDAGTRLDAAQAAAAGAGLKAMIPVGRPFLDYVLSALADAGFQHVCLVIGPEHEAVREYYTRTVNPKRIAIGFAIQPRALGTANAVIAAQEFAGGDQFLVINSDNYYPARALAAIQNLGRPGTVLFEAAALVREGNIPAERIPAFAYCIVDGEGFLADIAEKPLSFASPGFESKKLISMNCWRFGPDIFAACREVPLSPRGELELPVAVKLAIGKGMKLKAAICRAGVLDLSRRSDIAGVTARLGKVQVRL